MVNLLFSFLKQEIRFAFAANRCFWYDLYFCNFSNFSLVEGQTSHGNGGGVGMTSVCEDLSSVIVRSSMCSLQTGCEELSATTIFSEDSSREDSAPSADICCSDDELGAVIVDVAGDVRLRTI